MWKLHDYTMYEVVRSRASAVLAWQLRSGATYPVHGVSTAFSITLPRARWPGLNPEQYAHIILDEEDLWMCDMTEEEAWALLSYSRYTFRVFTHDDNSPHRLHSYSIRGNGTSPQRRVSVLREGEGTSAYPFFYRPLVDVQRHRPVV
eukprot:GHVU01052362.1.p1 GENE.GHVU01052362.1~~GHVU01052362.1.p1  ORF type:complete len:147 (-),score=1.62 GHVU01052362.1:182-622(-)